MQSTAFIPGLELARAFYREAVAPILARHAAGLAYSAALIGRGSEVIGYDSPRSTDHHWGPRVMLFLRDADAERRGDELRALLAGNLPREFRGYPTNFAPPGEDGSRLMQPIDAGPVAHRVELFGIDAFLRASLGFDPREGVAVADWLCTPSQCLRELTSGDIFHDGLGALAGVREALHWYPHGVWLYLIACQWQRIAEEEPFVARCDEAGDELGARIVAGRLARDIIRLCFLFERRHAPYSKWLGSAFHALDCAREVEPPLRRALAADSASERHGGLNAALTAAGRIHNALGITAPVDVEVRQFYTRPYFVLGADRFAAALRAHIDPALLATLPGNAGSIDQWADSTAVLSHPEVWRSLRDAVQGSDGARSRPLAG
jgi:hypothetical protein